MNSPFAWPGGKRCLVKRLLPLLPPHEAYAEVFCGSAKLLFAKEPSAWEVINDINGDLINFFRVAKHRSAELAEAFETECVASERFVELKTPQKAELDRALAFLYLADQSFGGKGEHFCGTTIQSRGSRPPVKKSLARIRETLLKTAQRLTSVLIENRDWRACIDRYDSSDTLFYLDPPYVNFKSLGRYEAPPEEMHIELLDRLAVIQGKFLLSHEDCPLIRTEAKRHGFTLREVETVYSLASTKSKKVRELVIANYKLPAGANNEISRGTGSR
jgi:DNA adenine methylase